MNGIDVTLLRQHDVMTLLEMTSRQPRHPVVLTLRRSALPVNVTSMYTRAEPEIFIGGGLQFKLNQVGNNQGCFQGSSQVVYTEWSKTGPFWRFVATSVAFPCIFHSLQFSFLEFSDPCIYANDSFPRPLDLLITPTPYRCDRQTDRRLYRG